MGQTPTAFADASPGVRWQCEPQPAPGDLWVLRCDDVQEQIDDDPALSDGPPKSGWTIPTWGMPLDPQMTVQLVRAALCRGADCGVSLKMDNRQWRGVVWTGPLSWR